MHENEISGEIVDAAYKIHRRIGPGLFESVYERTLRYELEQRGLLVLTQHPVPVTYESVQIDEAFRADLIVQNKVIVELKSVEKVAPVNKIQLFISSHEWSAPRPAHQFECPDHQIGDQSRCQRHRVTRPRDPCSLLPSASLSEALIP